MTERPIVAPFDVLESLLLALANRRFLVLAGPSGVGKTQVARHLAAAVCRAETLLGPGRGPEAVLAALREARRGLPGSVPALDGLFCPVPGKPDLVAVVAPPPLESLARDPAEAAARRRLHAARRLPTTADRGGDEAIHRRRVAFLPVHPDWSDARRLWGHYNPLTGRFYPTDALVVLLNAFRNFCRNGAHASTHFLILDEMNLARVEYYLADLLSLMESPCRLDPGRPGRILLGEMARVHPLDACLVSQGFRGIQPEGRGPTSGPPEGAKDDPSREPQPARPGSLDQMVSLFELEGTRWIYEALVRRLRVVERPEDVAVTGSGSDGGHPGGGGTGGNGGVGAEGGDGGDGPRDIVAMAYPIPPRIAYPPNLKVLGTVNADETTFGFAPKVLDRAFVVDFDHPVDAAAALEGHPGYTAAREFLEAVDALLEPIGLGLSYRVAGEVCDYVSRAGGRLTAEVADALLLGKVLPRLRGPDEVVGPALEGLLDLCQRGLGPGAGAGAGVPPSASPDGGGSPARRPAFPRAARKLARMRKAAAVTGFASFFGSA